LIDSNPVPKTKLPRRGLQAEKPEVRPEKIRELLDALPEPARSIATLLAFTGLRIGEMLALRWKDVDLDGASLQVRQAVYEGIIDEPKSQSSRRTVPLADIGVAMLRSRKPSKFEPEALVFSTRLNTPLSRRNLLNRQLKPTCEKLGLKGISWHWFRHANASLRSSAGTPLGTIQATLGHSSSDITREVYIHAVPEDARKSAVSVEGQIGPKWTQVPDFGKLATDVIQ